MTKLSLFAGAATLAAAFLSAPAMAQDSGVNCIATQYTAEQSSEISSIASNIVVGTTLNQDAMNNIGMVAMPAVTTCAIAEGWSQDQVMFAFFYELGRLSEAGFRGAGHVTQQEMARLDAALARPDSEDVWQAIENTVMASMGGTVTVDDADAMVMGEFLVSNGLDTGSAGTATPELMGMLVGFMALQRIGTREFLLASE